MEKDIFHEDAMEQEREVEKTNIEDWDDEEEDNLDFITEYKEESDEDETV